METAATKSTTGIPPIESLAPSTLEDGCVAELRYWHGSSLRPLQLAKGVAPSILGLFLFVSNTTPITYTIEQSPHLNSSLPVGYAIALRPARKIRFLDRARQQTARVASEAEERRHKQREFEAHQFLASIDDD